MKISKPPDVKRTVLKMIAHGQASVPELAKLSGISRHLIRAWCRSRQMSVDRARLTKLTKLWRKGLDGG